MNAFGHKDRVTERGVFCLGRRLSLAALLTCLAFPSYGNATGSSLTFTEPATNTTISSCSDYATEVLNDPWDMNNPSDINHFIPSVDFVNFNNVTFDGGIFKSNAATIDPHFQLLSPKICGAHAISGRWGQDFPVDTTKYRKLSFRMYTDKPSLYQVLWHHGCDYHLDWVITSPVSTQVGWHTYTIDLATSPASDSAGGVIPWSSKPVTGIRLDPTQDVGATVYIDWVRLEPLASNCGQTTVSYEASGVFGERLSVVLDNDTNPFNGFISPIVLGTAANDNSLTVRSDAQSPSESFVNGFLSTDYSTLETGNPWDFNDSGDYKRLFSINNASLSGGFLTGTTADANSLIELSLGVNGIDTSVYRYLKVKITHSTPSDIALFHPGGAILLEKAIHDPDGNGFYRIDLATLPSAWNGRVTDLKLRPALTAGVNFSLNAILLDTVQFRAEFTTPSVETAAGKVIVSPPPTFSFLQPDKHGGIAHKGWNFDKVDDVLEPANLSTAEILTFHNVSGRIGDFFHGVNIENNRDPVNYLSHPNHHSVSPLQFDAARFKHLTWTMAMPTVPGRVNVTDGSVMRVVYRRAGDAVETLFDGDDIVTIVDGWSASNWYEYYANMSEYLLEGGGNNWNGTIDGLRIDSHEFLEPYEFYFDHAVLRANDESNSQYAVTVDFGSNTATETADIFYTTTPSTNGGTLIGRLTSTDNTRTLLWNTSSVPDGTYYLYASVSTGISTRTQRASGPITVNHSINTSGLAPILSVEAPAEGAVFDGMIQLKGFALDEQQLASVEVLIDGRFFTQIVPKLFNLGAREQYPDLADSSNAGFNSLHSTGNLSNGQHTIVFRAIDMSGQVTETQRTIIKQAGATLAIVDDPEPNGSAISIGATPGRPGSPSIRSIKHNKKAQLSFDIAQLNGVGCIMEVFAGATEASQTDRILRIPVASNHLRKGIIRMVAKKFRVKSSLLPEIYLQASRTCPAQTASLSLPTKVRFKSKKGAGTYAQVLNLLRSELKQRAK